MRVPFQGTFDSVSERCLRHQRRHLAVLAVHQRPEPTDLPRNVVSVLDRVDPVRTDNGVNVADLAGGHEPIDGDQVSLGGESLDPVASQAAFLLRPRPLRRPCGPGPRIGGRDRRPSSLLSLDPSRSPAQSARPSSDIERSKSMVSMGTKKRNTHARVFATVTQRRPRDLSA